VIACLCEKSWFIFALLEECDCLGSCERARLPFRFVLRLVIDQPVLSLCVLEATSTDASSGEIQKGERAKKRASELLDNVERRFCNA
jgi:hypothetical protein